jgi:hypothetical protein
MNDWSDWKAMPAPEHCRAIDGPIGPGVYQVRNKITNQFIQFGEGRACQTRMQSLYPKPFGKGTRNNEAKRSYILQNWGSLEYRTLSTNTKEEAFIIDRQLKALKNHLFNT